jgi:hypothetical protein
MIRIHKTQKANEETGNDGGRKEVGFGLVGLFLSVNPKFFIKN